MQTLYPWACPIANIYGQTVPGQSRCGEHLSPESWNAAHYTCVCCHQTPAPVSPTLSQKVTETRWQAELGEGTFSVSPTVFPPLSAAAKTEDGTPPRPPIPKRRKRNIGHIILFLNLFLFSDVTSLGLFSLTALVFPSKKHDSEYRLTFF